MGSAAARTRPGRLPLGVRQHRQTRRLRAQRTGLRPRRHCRLKKAADVTDAEAVSYDGIVFGAPVYWQSISAEGKAFLDRVANAHQKAKANGDGRTAGVFVTAGAASSGKDLARLTMVAAFLAMRFTVIGGVDSEGFGTLGPQATTPPGTPVNDAAAEEARAFGERFARLTRPLPKW